MNNNPVVMVDDSDVDVMLMTRFISKSKIKNPILRFASGEAFLEYMDSIRCRVEDTPALVFLDINMPPGMNGFEVLEKLRQYAEFDDIPIVTFLTNSNNPADVARCEKLNVDMQEKFSDTKACVKYLNSLL